LSAAAAYKAAFPLAWVYSSLAAAAVAVFLLQLE